MMVYVEFYVTKCHKRLLYQKEAAISIQNLAFFDVSGGPYFNSHVNGGTETCVAKLNFMC